MSTDTEMDDGAETECRETLTRPLTVSGTNVFEVAFECINCGDEWNEEFPSSILVERTGGEVKVKEKEQFVDGGPSVECPTCELTEMVYVDSRAPLD